MSALCRVVAQRIPLAGPDESFGATLDTHVAECLTCQAEAARYRKLLRALSALSDDLEPAPAGLAAAVESALDAASRRRRPPVGLSRVAAATGAVAATAAGMLAVALWKRARHAA